MCGIAGAASASGIDPRDLVAMGDAIRHRGPDGEGYTLFGNEAACAASSALSSTAEAGGPPAHAGFAHRRLSIIDLTEASDQPLHDPSGELAIAYNGELYNYVELRDRARGRRPRVPDERRHRSRPGRLCGMGAGVPRADGRDVGAGDPRPAKAEHFPRGRPVRHQAALLHARRRRALLRLRDQGARRRPLGRTGPERGGGAQVPVQRPRRRGRPDLLRGRQAAAAGPPRECADRPAGGDGRAEALLELPGAELQGSRQSGRGRVRRALHRISARPPAQRRPRRDLPQRRARLLGDRLHRRQAAARRQGAALLAPGLRLHPRRRERLRAPLHGGGGREDRDRDDLRAPLTSAVPGCAARHRALPGRAVRDDEHRRTVVRLRRRAEGKAEGDARRAGCRRGARRLPRLLPLDRDLAPEGAAAARLRELQPQVPPPEWVFGDVDPRGNPLPASPRAA